MENKNLLDTCHHIHFVGIGGSGMCPIAEILFHRGYAISGSDMNEGDTLDRIKSYGIPVFMGHRAENIQGADLVVYTAAVKADNPELAAARAAGIPCIERSVMLGLLSDRYGDSIAVSGTHGKTTTTGMITTLFLQAGKDPSCVIGGKLPLIGSNGRAGKSDTLVCEACEDVYTFLHLHPAVSVILNIDNDHLDYFGTLENIIKSFRQFAKQTSRLLVINGDDDNTRKAVEGLDHAAVITYGFGEENRFSAREIQDIPGAREQFVIYKDCQPLCPVSLSVPGRHNILNALAAAAVGDFFGISPQQIQEGLHAFTGVHRRFEVLGEFDGVTVADDFAHHPTELTASLTAAMHMGFRQVWAVFQPHTYSRTYLLLDDFAKALQIPDHVVMTEILAVREENTYGIYTKDLAAKIPGSCWFQSFAEIAGYVMEKAQPGDLILTLGGGDIYKCANLIVEKYRARS